MEDARHAIKINNQTERSFSQGDCVSPILFTLYLANDMKECAGVNESASQWARQRMMREIKDEFGDRYMRESEENERKDNTNDRKKEDC